tara:strand:+ start:808 stop:1161 length:354 start_codon:yes stop_codon:yes gene_type:complete
MAGTAAISSTFVISVRPTDAVATVITNPGRAFRIIGVGANNTDAAVAHDVDVLNGILVVVPAAETAAATTYSMMELTQASCDVPIGAALTVTVANVAVDQVDIICVATGGGQALTAV